MKHSNADYKEAIQLDQELATDYYQKFLKNKSEQQKFLETLLNLETRQPAQIADIACGSGTLSYHIAQLYKTAKFSLVDINSQALSLAKRNLEGIDAHFTEGSIYDLKFEDNFFDLVFCWQTLSWLDEPQKGLEELIRICKKNGKIYLSSLFNINHDVDIYAQVIDHTRSSAKESIALQYNTLSKYTLEKWLKNKIKSFRIHPFYPQIDFNSDSKGLGTFTKNCEGKRIQISGGLLMNWGILEIEK